MLLGFLIHLYADCDYYLTRYAHILRFALPPTYGLVCTVTTISLSSCLSPHWMLDSCSILIAPLLVLHDSHSHLTISITLYILCLLFLL